MQTLARRDSSHIELEIGQSIQQEDDRTGEIRLNKKKSTALMTDSFRSSTVGPEEMEERKWEKSVDRFCYWPVNLL